jgi:hypothetical protein
MWWLKRYIRNLHSRLFACASSQCTSTGKHLEHAYKKLARPSRWQQQPDAGKGSTLSFTGSWNVEVLGTVLSPFSRYGLEGAYANHNFQFALVYATGPRSHSMLLVFAPDRSSILHGHMKFDRWGETRPESHAWEVGKISGSWAEEIDLCYTIPFLYWHYVVVLR